MRGRPHSGVDEVRVFYDVQENTVQVLAIVSKAEADAWFQSDEDWFEYQLERNPDFLRRIARGRAEIQRGLGVRLEDVPLSKVR
jgi:hypothetical protein